MAGALTTTTHDWDMELRGAAALLKSGLVPREIKTAEAALFIILTGRDLGMSPVQSLRSIRVIQGKVEVAADAQLGRFHGSGGRSRWVELTDRTARIELVAPWLSAPHVESFSLDDATRAGLASGDNWRKYPKAMLRSRAITAGLKSIGFDATAGIYGAGEISGEEIVQGETVGVVEVAEAATQSPPPAPPTDAQYAELEQIAADPRWSDSQSAALLKRGRAMGTMIAMGGLIESAIEALATMQVEEGGADHE